MDDLEQMRRAVNPTVQEQRRGYAHDAIDAYVNAALETGATDCVELMFDLDEILTDLLTDLWHFADGKGVDLEPIIGTARMHHDAETDNERNPQ